MDASIVGALIGAASAIVVAAGGWLATAKLRTSERRAAEAKRAASESDALNARYVRLVDELQEENGRLRSILSNREGQL